MTNKNNNTTSVKNNDHHHYYGSIEVIVYNNDEEDCLSRSRQHEQQDDDDPVNHGTAAVASSSSSLAFFGSIALVVVAAVLIMAASSSVASSFPKNNGNPSLVGLSTTMSEMSLVSSSTSSGGGKNHHKAHKEGEVEEEDITKEHFFHHQLIDHNDNGNNQATSTFSQRYYASTKYFDGPGSPIFFIFGGEDPLDGLLYPFIYEHLAKHFNAATFALEHRFYGKSVPVQNNATTNDQLHQLLSFRQPLNDAVTFIQYQRIQLGCSLDRDNKKEYCPVITVGGSMPGFLSGLMRFVHPNVVDISYASSAPFNLYSHHVNQFAYYDKVTSTADDASPGCAPAVRDALRTAQTDIIESDDTDLDHVAKKYGVCQDSVPEYIQSTELFAQELMLIIATHFANGNMDYYPPNKDQALYKGCRIFQNHHKYKTPHAMVAAFLKMDAGDDDDGEQPPCFDMMTELPPGPDGRISASDWSGVGAGPEGYYWDYQSCLLLPECGFSEQSMFPPRRWTLDWITDHCMRRFDLKPNLHALEDEFGFDDRSDVTHLLLTNGIVDGWSVASIMVENDIAAPGVRIVNMVHGAHHSDLSHTGPTKHDTLDVREAFFEIREILGGWLDEIMMSTE